MMRYNQILILALVIPIMGLLGLVAYKRYIITHGTERELSISGYDPRDLLAGHYLTYRVEYNVSNLCDDSSNEKQEAFICLESRLFSYNPIEDCPTMIRGFCMYHRFEAGIERFYIPESQADVLERKIRDHKASIIVSILQSGKAQVKELLIDGQPWKELR